MRDTRRSPEAARYRTWYKTPRWQMLRKAQLARAPLCRYCQEMGHVTAGAVVDHRIPHKGDEGLFFDPANLQTLCQLHHNSSKQREEKLGRPIPRYGLDGWAVED